MEVLQAGAIGIQEENRLTLTIYERINHIADPRSRGDRCHWNDREYSNFQPAPDIYQYGAYLGGAVEFNRNAKQSLQDDNN